MKTFNNLYFDLCSYDNLHRAFKKARKRKTLKPYVIEFEKDLKNNLLNLRLELLFHSYYPMPLKTFILRDPKTRKISRSEFRDRVVHHALCNVIEPILAKKFIHDSFANQIGKGTLAAIKRFEKFKRKISRNYSLLKDGRNVKGFILKADIKQFFDTVNHSILLNIIKRNIKDKRIIWLIKIILSNYKVFIKGVGMPLGNLTSQFFANVYLNELDYFVKHKLRVRFYIRYVDDFVIMHRSREKLMDYKNKIDEFLVNKLALVLHPEKSKIFPLYKGTTFLGLKLFAYHLVIRKKNIRKFMKKLNKMDKKYNQDLISYDKIYDCLEGWFAYSKHADMYKFRNNLMAQLEKKFQNEISTKEINRALKFH